MCVIFDGGALFCLQLCRHGADPNVINAVGDNAMTMLLTSLSRWLYHASDDSNRLEV